MDIWYALYVVPSLFGHGEHTPRIWGQLLLRHQYRRLKHKPSKEEIELQKILMNL